MTLRPALGHVLQCLLLAAANLSWQWFDSATRRHVLQLHCTALSCTLACPLTLLTLPHHHRHAAGEGAMLAYDPEARAALLAAHKRYSPGAEVFDSHGPGLSWADLVMDHGCVGEGSSDNSR
jgi:hypothetical protein